MGGGLMQLVAYGAQDVYLTGNPQITFFKTVYRRHTNFSMEAIEQTFNGQPGFGRRVTCTVSRNGDLVHKMYLRVTLPRSAEADANDSGAAWESFVGEKLVKSVELEIGGQRIDKHYGDWMHIWNELSLPADKRAAYDEMIGNVARLTTGTAVNVPAYKEVGISGGTELIIVDKDAVEATNAYCVDDCTTASVPTGPVSVCTPREQLFIPLQFWFNRNPGLALPLIALQYHEVKLNVEFQPKDVVVVYGKTGQYEDIVSADLLVDYIFLDTDERRRFAQVSHEYLIEQLQFTGDESTDSASPKIKLNFNHPCKELVWTVQPTYRRGCGEGKDLFNYGLAGPDAKFGAENIVRSAKLQLNGHDRFAEQAGKYFDVVQPFQHHTAAPSRGVNVYSFGLKPEEHQPSGTCNMSRIDNATLNLSLAPAALKQQDGTDGGSATVRVYATNYNVLRIMSGMGGVAYSN
jgi:hypothetical protein